MFSNSVEYFIMAGLIFFIYESHLVTVVLEVYLNINQLDALNFIMSLFQAFTCFEHHVLIIRRSKLYYTVSGIITHIGGRPMHRLREDTILAS